MNDDIAALIADAGQRAARYVASVPDRVVTPDLGELDALQILDRALPDTGIDAAEVLALLDDVGSPATVAATGGRYFGFVNGGSLPVATAANILAAAWDQNVALPVMSPIGALLDTVAARWVVELLGLPSSSAASFCGGASIANLTCLIAARDAVLARAGWDAQAHGLSGAPEIEVIAGAETHLSVIKALGAAGLGRDRITWVPTDDRGRLVAEAIKIGSGPTIVLSQAGNVNTGHSDPFLAIAARADGTDAWIHVDGAFGLWAAASPSASHLVAGVERADSWATDGHKWPNLPYDSGIAICARAEDMRRSMASDAAYLGAHSGRAPMHLGLQMSQRARGVEMYAALANLGRSGVADLVDRLCARAAQLAGLLSDGGVHVLTPPGLNQVLVAYGSDNDTEAVIGAVQASGELWAGGTTWQGRRAMRLSISSWATTEADIAASAATILRLFAEVQGA